MAIHKSSCRSSCIDECSLEFPVVSSSAYDADMSTVMGFDKVLEFASASRLSTGNEERAFAASNCRRWT